MVAKGRGVVAERLIAMARESGVPIVENKLLVEMLENLNLNQEIPGELYQVVAEILAFVYRTHRYYFYRLKSRRVEADSQTKLGGGRGLPLPEDSSDLGEQLA